jgi:hypothetical protein
MELSPSIEADDRSAAQGYRTWRFIAVFTRALNWSLSWARLIQSCTTPSYFSKIHYNIIFPPTSRCAYWCLSFWLKIGFIDHFNTQLVNTSNYGAIANLHTLQITRACTKSFLACNVFTIHFLVMASNSGDSSVSTFMHCWLATISQLWTLAPVVLLIMSWHGPHRKYHLQQLLYCYTWTRCHRNLFFHEGVNQ